MIYVQPFFYNFWTIFSLIFIWCYYPPSSFFSLHYCSGLIVSHSCNGRGFDPLAPSFSFFLANFSYSFQKRRSWWDLNRTCLVAIMQLCQQTSLQYLSNYETIKYIFQNYLAPPDKIIPHKILFLKYLKINSNK